jgi:hypothetical protein
MTLSAAPLAGTRSELSHCEDQHREQRNKKKRDTFFEARRTSKKKIKAHQQYL